MVVESEAGVEVGLAGAVDVVRLEAAAREGQRLAAAVARVLRTLVPGSERAAWRGQQGGRGEIRHRAAGSRFRCATSQLCPGCCARSQILRLRRQR